MFASGAARRRRPVHRRALRGRGVSSLGSLTLARRLSWARAMRPPLGTACRRAMLPRLVLGAKNAPPALVCRCRAAAPCLVLGASRPAPLSSAPILPAAACSRSAVCNFIVCACITQPPLQKHIKTAPKNIKKRQKARFLCGISPQASLNASTDSTLISPICGAYWAAVDAAQSLKRYLKPSTWWGAAPFRAGGKAPMPPHSGLRLLQPL